MNLIDGLQYIQSKLIKVSDSPYQEAIIILSFITSLSREDIEIKKKELSKIEIQKINSIIEKRQNNIPLSQITQKKFFYNSEFKINSSTLIPRNETELLIEITLKYIHKIFQNIEQINILEIGTGSGCVVISIIKEIMRCEQTKDKKIHLTATEIQEKTINITKHNILNILKPQKIIKNTNTNFHSQITSNISLDLLKHDILKEPINNIFKQHYNLIISNPPYIPTNELKTLPKDVQKEPILALNGGKDGLFYITKILENTRVLNNKNTKYIFELHSTTTKDLYYKFNSSYEIEILKDLNKLNRFVIMQRII